jgi:hypothetical protein
MRDFAELGRVKQHLPKTNIWLEANNIIISNNSHSFYLNELFCPGHSFLDIMMWKVHRKRI